MANTAAKMLAELSGGMHKRIALDRTRNLRLEIILYDEPIAGLDIITGREVDHRSREV